MDDQDKQNQQTTQSIPDNPNANGIAHAVDELKALRQEFERIRKQNEEYLNAWKRAQADFANYKKDEARRVEELLKYGGEDMIISFLDVLDNLELAIQAAKNAMPEQNGWIAGFEQIQKQYTNILKKYGVQRIHVAGQRFDPLLHEAVETSAEGELVEVRPGYTLHGKVIRPARVTYG